LSVNRIRKIQRRLLDYVVKNHAAGSLETRAETLVRLFENQIPVPSSILDVGGGWGFYSEPLRRRGHHVTVLDVIKPGFQKSPVVLYGGGKIPFADNSYDVSMLITVLHHISDIEEVFREVCRVTRRFVVVVEDLYNHPLGRLWTILRDQLYNFEFFGHPRNFKSKDEWLSFFQGFGVLPTYYRQASTRLAGMNILNGVFVLERVPVLAASNEAKCS